MSLHCGSVFSRLSKRSAIRYHTAKLRKIGRGSSVSRSLVAKISCALHPKSDVHLPHRGRHPTGCVTVAIKRSCTLDPR